MRLRSFVILFALGGAARAGNVREEATVNTIHPTAANPSSGSFTDSLSGAIDLSSEWTLNLGGSLTLQSATPAFERGQFGESGSAVLLFTAGTDWAIDDNFTIGTELQVSPRSTQFAGTTMTLRQASGAEVSADALVRSQTSQAAAGLNVSWDSSGDSDLEWSWGAGIDYTHYGIDQNVPAVRLADGTTVASTTLRQETVSYCQAHPSIRNCGQALLTALAATPVTLDAGRLSANATATLFKDTDVGFSGEYDVYAHNPGQVGFFTLVAAGRTAGVPIAPLRFQVRPEVVQRFGDFSARVWAQAGRYMPGTGQSTLGAGLRLQYKFTKAFRSWVQVSGQRDVDQSDQITRSTSLSGGVAYRW